MAALGLTASRASVLSHGGCPLHGADGQVLLAMGGADHTEQWTLVDQVGRREEAWLPSLCHPRKETSLSSWCVVRHV